MRPKLVIFDCDGVLIDSEPLAVRALRETLAETGVDISEAVAAEEFLGLSWPSTRAALERDHGVWLTDAAVEKSRQRLFELFRRELLPIAGAAQAIDALEAAEIRVCVASSSSPERLETSLGATGLFDRLHPHIYSATMVARGKPAPDLFLHAAEKMEVGPEECLVIEDSPAGVRAARAAAMTVFGFTGGGHARLFDLKGRLEALAPDAVFDNFRDLASAIL